MFSHTYFPDRTKRRGQASLTQTEYNTLVQRVTTLEAAPAPLTSTQVQQLILGAGLFRRTRTYLTNVDMTDDDWKCFLAFDGLPQGVQLTFQVRQPTPALGAARNIWTPAQYAGENDNRAGTWTLLCNHECSQGVLVKIPGIEYNPNGANLIRGRNSAGVTINQMSDFTDVLPVNRFALLMYVRPGRYWYYVF